MTAYKCPEGIALDSNNQSLMFSNSNILSAIATIKKSPIGEKLFGFLENGHSQIKITTEPNPLFPNSNDSHYDTNSNTVYLNELSLTRKYYPVLDPSTGNQKVLASGHKVWARFTIEEVILHEILHAYDHNYLKPLLPSEDFRYDHNYQATIDSVIQLVNEYRAAHGRPLRVLNQGNNGVEDYDGANGEIDGNNFYDIDGDGSVTPDQYEPTTALSWTESPTPTTNPSYSATIPQIFLDKWFNPNIINPQLGSDVSCITHDMTAQFEAWNNSKWEHITPLVIDLDADGLELIEPGKSNIWYDMTGDGVERNTGWIGPDDGLLAVDLNDNGEIDDISELFGSPTENGFVQLEGYDSNNDNVIDAQDDNYADLMIWQDLDSDGWTDAGELQSLTYWGITEISLNDTDIADIDLNGNIVTHESSIMMNGFQGYIADVQFGTNPFFTDYQGTVGTITSSIEALPFLKGFGKLPDTHIAMSNDTAFETTMQALYDDYGSLADIEADVSGFRGAVEDMLYEWAGVEAVSTTGRGTHVDGRKLAFLEQFFGEDYVNALGYTNPQSANEGYELNTNFDTLVLLHGYSLIVQTDTDVGAVLHYDPITGTVLNLVSDYADMVSNAPTDTGQAALYWGIMAKAGSFDGFNTDIKAIADKLLTIKSDFTTDMEDLFGLRFGADSTADNIYDLVAEKLDFNKIYITGTGADTIQTSGGNNLIYAGAGDDTITGLIGGDTILFDAGDGHDTFTASYYRNARFGDDTIIFGPNIDVADVSYSQGGTGNDDLIITIGTGGDQIDITEWFDWAPYLQGDVTRIFFDDGTVHDVNDILQDIGVTPGTSGDDVMYGWQASDDTIDGLAGNDTIWAYGGVDNIIGGTGNDTLYGDWGDDKYNFDLGDGDDTISEYLGTDHIYFGSGIAVADVSYSKSGYYDLTIDITGGDSITVKNVFTANGNLYYAIEDVTFDDNTVHTMEYMYQEALTQNGTTSAETLYGIEYHDDYLYGDAGDDDFWSYGGDDYIDGGAGSDDMYGANGNDTYWYDSGDGNDYIIETSGYDTIQLSSAYDETDVTYSKSGYHILIDFAGGGQINVYNALYNANGTKMIDEIRFDNGTIHYADDILQEALEVTGSGGYLYGTNFAETLNGAAGTVADWIYAYDGNDIINSGAGVDWVYGYDGHDTINAGDDLDYVYGGNDEDTIDGGGGNDVLYGDAGDDFIFGGTGADSIWGGTGADIFDFGDTASIDAIKDFSTTQGDALRFADILIGYDPLDDITDFIEITDSGANSVVKVDLDGTGSTYSLTQVATLEGITGLTDEADLLSNGYLIAA